MQCPDSNPPSNSAPCTHCGEPLAPREIRCTRCGAGRRPVEEARGYEYRSAFLWMGLPLVHIAFGSDETGRARVATGVIAIGQRATGWLAIGIIATGFVSVGVIAVGVFSVGVVSVAAFAAAGVNAVAPFAFGVVAFGHTVGGVAAIGWKVLFSSVR